MNGNVPVKLTPQSQENLKVVRNLTDYSGLSDKMLALCKNLPIYLVRKGVAKQNDMDQANNDVMADSDLDSDLIQLPAKRK